MGGVAVIAKIRLFYDSYFAIGDRLGERFYAIWMVVVSIGLLNSGGLITPDRIHYVVAIAFMVNLGWGVIDGVTVMLTNIITRAENDRMLFDLRSSGDARARDAALDALDDGLVSALPDDERQAIVARLAAAPAGPDPRARAYKPTRQDWLYALGIVGIDVAAVIPVVAPIVLIADPATAVYVSRLVATVVFATIGVAYAGHLNYRCIPAAILLGGLGFALFTAAYAKGW